MLTFVPVQIALSAGIALTFVLLYATTRRAAARRWTVFYCVRLAGLWITVPVIASAGTGTMITPPRAPGVLVAISLVAIAQVALMSAVWSHGAPAEGWSRWRTSLVAFQFGAVGVVALLLWRGSAMSIEVAVFAGRMGALLASLLCAAAVWSARSRINRLGARFLMAALALSAANYLMGVVYVVRFSGTPLAYGVSPALAGLQVLSVMALSFASLYLLLAEERNMLHAKAVEHEHSRHLESLGRVASGAAHDFNNVLGAMQLTAEAVRESETPAERQVELGYLGGAIERGQMLVDSLAAYARNEPTEVGTLDVDEAIRSLAPVLRRLLLPNQTLALELPSKPLRARLDRGQLDRAISNLVTNARDAMPLGGVVVVRASSTLTAGGGMEVPRVAIEVQDAGQGMPPDILARVFEPYFTTKALGRGTGLGLSLCHSFVTQQGGEVRITSNAGSGTTVTLLFPAPAAVAS